MVKAQTTALAMRQRMISTQARAVLLSGFRLVEAAPNGAVWALSRNSMHKPHLV